MFFDLISDNAPIIAWLATILVLLIALKLTRRP